MAVWLRCGAAELAFDDDIVPHEAFARLEQLDALDTVAQEGALALQAEAQADAAAIRAGGVAAAEALTAKARRDAGAATRLGYAQGRKDALRHWHAEAILSRRAAAALAGSQRERLADLVVQATASLLEAAAPGAYLASALRVLDQLAEKDLTLSLTVHPDDRATAQQAIEQMRPLWRDGTVVKLLESAALAPASCICESPQGYIDASLSQQLASLRLAALGALADLQLPDDIVAPEPVVPVPVIPPPVLQHASHPFGLGASPGRYDLDALRYPGGGDLDDEDADEDGVFDDLFDREAGPGRPW